MTKLRVYELSRELNIDSKILMNRMKSLGITVASHQSTLTDAEIAKIRNAIAGGVVPASAANSAAKTVVKTRPGASAPVEAMAEVTKPKVVVRRRKAAEPEVVSAPEKPGLLTVSVEEELQRVSAAAKELKAELAPEVKPPIPQPAEEKKLAEAISEPEIVHASEEKPAVEAKVLAEELPTPIIETPVATEPVKSPQAPVNVIRSEEIRRRAMAQSGGGATIVRRASPEEIEAEKKRLEEKAKNDEYQSRTSRREDSRGMRVTGVGLLQNRGRNAAGSEKGPGVAAGSGTGETTSSTAPVQRDWTTLERPKSDKRYNSKQEEEEAAAKLAKLKKEKRGNTPLNVRTLLSQVEDLEKEIGDPQEPDAPEVAPTTRTVFTPGLSDRRKGVKQKKTQRKTEITMPRASYRKVKMGDSIVLNELAKQMSVKSVELIKKLMVHGVMATLNQEIDLDTATLIAQEYQFEVEYGVEKIEDIVKPENSTVFPEITRPAIVTVMGHVDHGKTSILDAIRKADVAQGEAGGITQHIGAYTVVHNNKTIAFLDTPGHEAFSSMRARGAKVTDIVILVVAADDGVMPQTVEAISHAKSAGVPIIVAVNKIDKPNQNLDRIYSQLAEHGIQAEDWGGENQFVKVSAVTKQGIDELLDAIILQAEVLDLKAQIDSPMEGSVIEAHLDKGRGPVATVMVQNGTLKTGDYIVAGVAFGRVRAMLDHHGKRLDTVGASTPVAIFGLDVVPNAGDTVYYIQDERTARQAVQFKVDENRKANKPKTSAASLDDLLGKIKSAETLEVAYIVKADVQGSLEAICEALLKLNTPKVSNRIIHKGVGGVNESEMNLAKTSGAVLMGFNVRAPKSMEDSAEKNGIVLKYFSIIYDLVDAAKAIMTGKLPPIVTEVILGRAQVRQPFQVPKIGTVAGSSVTDGKITRQSSLRLIRENVVIYNGKVGSLRRFKDDVKEVVQGYECGISIDGYNDIREGDVIEAFTFEEKAASLN